MSWFPMDMSGYGSGVTLMHGEGYTPTTDGIMIYFTAPEGSVRAGIAKAEEQGITILEPHTSIGEHGFYAVLKDSEGNRFSIHSMEE